MKNFENFKQEVIKRCKEQSACETEFKRVLKSKTFEELIKVITDNFNWSCNNKIIDIYINNNVFIVFIQKIIFFDIQTIIVSIKTFY